MHISGLWSDKKVDIHTEEVDIRDLEVDIESFFADKTVGFSGKTQSHIRQMFEKFGFDKIFGRSAWSNFLDFRIQVFPSFFLNYQRQKL